MPTIWFILVAVMLTAYVILDGFDLGAGALHLLIAKTDKERQFVIRTIGPVWDGNEVWLIAAGGTLYFAFPLLYASGFSGFYLPLMIVLWLLILRGMSIEFRMHIASQVWRGFFDGLFALASTLLAVFFGAALGNVLRGVPLHKDGYFFAPLWTNWRIGPEPGILDWYTVIAGLLALIALTIHGANYVALKTEGEVRRRARRISNVLWPLLAALTIISLIATLTIRPELLDNYQRFPVAYVIPLLVLASLGGMFMFGRPPAAQVSEKPQRPKHATGIESPITLRARIGASENNDLRVFLSSCSYLAMMLVGAAVAVYPNLLISSSDPSVNVTIYKAASGHYSLSIGLIWWGFGMLLAVAYFVFVYRMFRGKVSLDADGHGY